MRNLSNEIESIVLQNYKFKISSKNNTKSSVMKNAVGSSDNNMTINNTLSVRQNLK